MATEKTEATELSVAFGILGIPNPSNVGLDVQTLFDGTMTEETFNSFLHEYAENPVLYNRFIQNGILLRERQFPNVQTIHWTGAQRQASSTMASIDLFIPAFNMPISVKNESNVVANPSPNNLLRRMPRGEVVVRRGTNWFLEMDAPGLQAMYINARTLYNNSSRLSETDQLPETVTGLFTRGLKQQRKRLQDFINNLTGQEADSFINLYNQMCNSVAIASVEEFNWNYASLAANVRTTVNESFVKLFFRIDNVPYVLTGIDGGVNFGIRIPNITSWNREWVVQNISAEVRPGGQSMLHICLSILQRHTRVLHMMDYRVEIRWSHGKFCGNPEGKLYKEFPWRSVPFFEILF
jgi:hypothetical protein